MWLGGSADWQEYPPLCVDCSAWGEEDETCKEYRRAFINPEIYEVSEETELFNEGCLSLPGMHEDVRRPIAIKMRYLDENFEEHDELFEGFRARVLQHSMTADYLTEGNW